MLRQDFGLNILIFLCQNNSFNSDTNSSNHGHINILIANLQFGLRYFLYIRSVSSSSQIERIASIDLFQIVSGAMSDWMKSTHQPPLSPSPRGTILCEFKISSIFSVSVTSCI